MKKLLFTFILLISSSVMFAYDMPAPRASHKQHKSLWQLVKTSDRAGIRKAFEKGVSQEEVRTTDSNGNTILHVANYKTFSLLWNILKKEDLDYLLAQRNKAGENPIMYNAALGKEKIVAKFWPRTEDYQQLMHLANAKKQGQINQVVDQIKLESIWRSYQVGGQDMRQRTLMLRRYANERGYDTTELDDILAEIDQVIPKRKNKVLTRQERVNSINRV